MTLDEFVKESVQKLNNPVKGIPFAIPGLANLFPYFNKGERILIVGDTGSGKSSFNLFIIINTIDYILNNPDIEGKLYYFSIELSSKIIYAKIFCYLIEKQEHKKISIQDILNPEKLETIQLMKKVYPTMKLIESKLIINDVLKQPEHIIQYMRNEMKKYGVLKGDLKTGFKFEYNNPNTYVFCIVDTINALIANTGSDQYESVKKWSENQSKIELSNVYDCVVINCQQLDNQLRTNQFANNGLKVEAKHKPTLGNLATVKTTPNDHTIVISLFMPHRYDLNSYKGFPIKRIKNHYIELSVLKSNFTELGEIDLYYNGNGNYELMPNPVEKKEELEKFLNDRNLKNFQTSSKIENYFN